MALRGFTVSRRIDDPCPHGCNRWACRIVNCEFVKVKGPDGHDHNENCPIVRKPNSCGYCGSERGSNDYNECLDCGSV